MIMRTVKFESNINGVEEENITTGQKTLDMRSEELNKLNGQMMKLVCNEEDNVPEEVMLAKTHSNGTLSEIFMTFERQGLKC